MRNLTIKRRKKYAACLATMKVYIEDHVTSEIVIGGTPCRKIGELKNGEEKVFPIVEDAVKVYVIGDTLSKEYCNDFYQITEGSDDVFLEGENKVNPATGNGFLFDNNNSAEALENRKKGSKKGLIVIIIAVIVAVIVGGIVGFFIGFLGTATGAEKTFSDAGMNIVLTDNFKKYAGSGYTVAYDSNEVAVFGLEEKFSLSAELESYTLNLYAEAIIANNGNIPTNTQIKTDGDLVYFEYDFTNTETKESFHYYTFVYKEYDAFWFVQFAMENEDRAEYADDVFKWAKSVSFDQ